jgi:hypothetical protein
MGFKCLVRDQEVDGSNPFAPTTSFLMTSYVPPWKWPASQGGVPRGLLAVGHPDVFDLNGVVEEPPAFALFQVEPVDGAAFVGEHLFQITN